MRRKKFFETYQEAKKFKKTYFNSNDRNIAIYDLKKTFPRRKKTKYFVGDYIEWLGI